MEVVPVAASKGLTPEQRSLRGKIAGYSSWKKTKDRTARTQAGRDAFRESFQDVVDPDHVLPPIERAKAGEAAYREHMARLAFESSKRRKKAENKTKAGNRTRPPSKTGDVTSDASSG
jgi:hypothetical protein